MFLTRDLVPADPTLARWAHVLRQSLVRASDNIKHYNVAMPSEAIQRAAQAIRDADALLIGAGAGMGVDSGLPDFRGNQGFWKAYPPMKKAGLSFYDMADPIWFHRNPRQAWGFYGHRLNLYRNTKPHGGFSILRRWAQRCPVGSYVFTSNVDGHFQAGGFAEASIVECHGAINWLQCSDPCCDSIWPGDDLQITVDETTFLADEPLPTCARCNRIARPNILMFGDASWLSDRTSSQHNRYEQWLGELSIDEQGQARHLKLVGIELGAGTAIPTVRHELERQTRGSSSTLIRINPRESQSSHGISIALGALEALEQIAELM